MLNVSSKLKLQYLFKKTQFLANFKENNNNNINNNSNNNNNNNNNKMLLFHCQKFVVKRYL